MTYVAAHIARATGHDPMTVLHWPPDVLRAVLEVHAGADPVTAELEDERFDSNLEALKAIAGRRTDDE